MKKIIKWLATSNRYKHLVGGLVLGFTLSILCAIGCAGGMEFKDMQWGGRWDWTDFLITIAGGLIGQALQIIAIILIF